MDKTVKNGLVNSMLDLIFNGDWDTVDEFDQQFDELVEYSRSLQESVDAFKADVA